MSSLGSEAKYRAHECTEDYLEGFIFYLQYMPSGICCREGF